MKKIAIFSSGNGSNAENIINVISYEAICKFQIYSLTNLYSSKLNTQIQNIKT